MSRNSKWKLEKTKVKVVFRLQCHATHIPQTGWNNLFVSIIPTDTGKATAKTNKAAVRNGTCKWSDPIYETSRLLQDAKTKHFEEKLYKLVVAMGTSRSSIFGEATINLSDYVDALKPTNIALPLHGSDTGAILNVTVQLLTSKTGFREFEQQREVTDRGLPITTDLDSGQLSSPGDAPISRADKVNHRARLKPEPKELPSLEEETGFSEEYSDSAEKCENSSTRENDSVKSEVREVSPSRPKPEKGTLEWVHHLGTEIPMDSEIANVYEENRILRRDLEAADQSVRELKREVSSLQTHADDIAVETRTIAEQLTHEIASEKELVKEVSLLKSECLRFKDDLEWLRNLKMNASVPKQDSSLRLLKGLSVVEDKIREVQSKVQLINDPLFLHSDIEALLGVLHDLKQETELSVYTNVKVDELGLPKIDHITSDSGLGAELCLPEGVLLPGLLSHADPTNAMQAEIFKLLRELDESKSERDSLATKMDQMECYYEALIQELEENQKQILGELQNLRNEHSSCVYAISSTNAQMEAMHKRMSDELLILAEERCNLDAINKDLEKRAVSSEAALKRARLNYSIAVNQLQKDLEMLSLQVISMYETNANLIKKAFSEASPILLEDPDAGKVVISRDLDVGVKSQPLGGDRFVEELKRSLSLQEELYKKIQEELSEMHLVNVHLDVFSLMLHQALLEEAANNRVAKEKIYEFAKQLEVSSECNESLKVKLRKVTDDLRVLNEEKAVSVLRCNDLALQNQTLEANLNAISEEKSVLSEKITELETLVTEYRSFKGKHENCDADKEKSTILLEQAAAENERLSDEIFLSKEELKTVKSKVSELSLSEENLQKMIDYLRERLENLVASGGEQEFSLPPASILQDNNLAFEVFKEIMLNLEGLHKNFHHKTLQLLEEKKTLQNERDIAECVKQKFHGDLPDIVSKLNMSCTLVKKLQTDLESVSDKLKVSSEAEEKYTRKTQDLLADFAKMQALLQDLTSKNTDLADEITALGSVTDDLEENKLIIDKITQENLELVESLQKKTRDSDVLALELNDFRETVRILENELSCEKGVGNHLKQQLSEVNTEKNESFRPAISS